LAPEDSYPQHVVTAVLVTHDGASWLPRLLDSLLGQSRPVQRVVAVDTASNDRSAEVLAGRLGPAAVLGMERAAGYATAVTYALAHDASSGSAAGLPAPPGQLRGERSEWIWLLHDDCELAPDALEQLLRGAAETPAAAVLGPKVRDLADRSVIVEAGVTIDSAGRRITGIEPREVDQGQHDGDRDVLAVGSAGMLVRRDLWDQAGGFDTGMALLMEDVDFCWRVHSAGYRVRVITDAVIYHARAATRRRRRVSVGRHLRLLDRRNSLLTLFGNLPARPMLASMAGNVAVSALRSVYLMIAKRPAAAVDEIAGVASVLGHPFRLLKGRRLRSDGRREAYERLRAELPPARSLRQIAEFAAAAMSRSGHADKAGSHHATEDPADDDSLLTDTGAAQQILTSPVVLLLAVLVVVAAVAERSLLHAGPLGGGALMPAFGGASDLWRVYLQGFHPTGLGSASAAPPYLAIIAALATLLGGSPWLAVNLLLLGSVPLAGLTAYTAARSVTRVAAIRVWAAAAYALLPVATGAVAAGRLPAAAVFVLLPLIALQAGRMLTRPRRQARRAAWAAGLLIAAGAAFVPLLWVIAVAAALAALVAAVVLQRRVRAAQLLNPAITVAVPPVLLLPWTARAISSPAALLLEPGLHPAGLSTAELPARALLLLSPGGPGLPASWATAGLLVVAVAALLARRRRALMLAGWVIALLGMGFAVAVSRLAVAPPGGGPRVTPWPGVPLAVTAIGLLLAACATGDALAGRLGRKAAGRKAAAADALPEADAPRDADVQADAAAGAALPQGAGAVAAAAVPTATGPGLLAAAGPAGRSGGWRQNRSANRAGVAVVALVALSAPVLAAAFWVTAGVRGPVRPAGGQVVPELVSVSAARGQQARTLVLRSEPGGLTYSVLRGSNPSLADPDLVQSPAAGRALDAAVATLVAPEGGEALNQGQLLAQFDIGFVLLRAPVSATLAAQLNGAAGLSHVAATPGYELWRLDSAPNRLSVIEPDGTVVPIPAGPVTVTGAAAPKAGGILELAEPAGGWRATLNGRPLASVRSPAGWAQAFRLPRGGGTLAVSRSGPGHSLLLIFELIAVLAVAALALPGVRLAEQEGAAAAGAGTASAAGTAGAADGGRLEAGDPDAAAGTRTGPRQDQGTAPPQGVRRGTHGGRSRGRPLGAPRRAGVSGLRRATRGSADAAPTGPSRGSVTSGAAGIDLTAADAGEFAGAAGTAYPRRGPEPGLAKPGLPRQRQSAEGSFHDPASMTGGATEALAGRGRPGAPDDYAAAPYYPEPNDHGRPNGQPATNGVPGPNGNPESDGYREFSTAAGSAGYRGTNGRAAGRVQPDGHAEAGAGGAAGSAWPAPGQFAGWPAGNESSEWPAEDTRQAQSPGWADADGPAARPGEAGSARLLQPGDAPPRWFIPDSEAEEQDW